MKKSSLLVLVLLVSVIAVFFAAGQGQSQASPGAFVTGKPSLNSMSALTFGPDGSLYVAMNDVAPARGNWRSSLHDRRYVVVPVPPS